MPFDMHVPDWEGRLERGESLLPDGIVADKARAERAVSMFNNLRLPDVIGMPTLRESAGEWQRDIVRGVFGSVDDSGQRLVSEMLAMVPKKSSKTTAGAAICLVAMLMNERPNGRAYMFGPTQAIANTAYSAAVGMIKADPFLSKRFKVRDHIKVIVDLTNGSQLEIKTFDMRTVTGIKPFFVLLDELHLMVSVKDSDRVLTQIRGGMISQPEAFLAIITTQSDVQPRGIFKEELNYARQVRDGEIEGGARVLPILYELPESIQKNDEWRKEKYWPWVCPNLGLSFTIDKMRSLYKEAVEKGGEHEARFASQHLNVEINLSKFGGGWGGADFWVKQAMPGLSLAEIKGRSEVCVVGIDGGGLSDLSALCVIGRDKVTRDWLSWHHCWASPSVMERHPQIADTLRVFAKEGDLTIVPEDQPNADFHEMAEIIVDLENNNLLPKSAAVGVDPAGIAELVDLLRVSGLEESQLVSVPQGFKLSSSIWGSERKLRDGNLWHCGSPMMAWQVGQAVEQRRGNAVYIHKSDVGGGKIDGVVSMFCAFALMARNPVGQSQPKLLIFG